LDKIQEIFTEPTKSQNLKIMMFDPNPTVARDVLGIIKKNLLLEVRLTVHLPHEIIWNANLRCGWCTAPSAPHTRPTQQISRPPPIQKLGAENQMLQLNI